MITVRDQTVPKTEYKGRSTLAVDKACPCRPCYNSHDCGYRNSLGEWVTRMYCATNYNNGCPTHPLPEPEHEIPPGCRKCRRCGMTPRKAKEPVDRDPIPGTNEFPDEDEEANKESGSR